ncbi:N-acetylmannosamine-6-phosphate 2-epimerase [Oceanobacillus arenosus]|uniref:Putative N-acetylmannosamine-6-phosphate 2-epimerase n=1 Tax=Oceanobacillus arenosus TaxID=1229153 RepID=A0A3D8Q335_9BACI|nr:N-acetylmannosamine-6-phosphate 2-epimerase [Oceanobacillus arenosus]RDW22198.1 N-acetylmannosamine-6-phosphate 2-epimerase [Oceanobacillus arenosus]
MKKMDFLKAVKNQLIVSCQAAPGEPLFGSTIMSKMSLAAKEGGAVAIRANGKEDIIAIRKATGLPTIGIIKREYENSGVYITPTLTEVQELIESGTEVIALDATRRIRPNNVSLEELIAYIKKNSHCLIMGDVSTAAEGKYAIEAGCDFVSTTLSGYTPYSRQLIEADFELIKELSTDSNIIILAEGRINSPEDASKAIKFGAYSVVVGTSITRPTVVTKRFVDKMKALTIKLN